MSALTICVFSVTRTSEIQSLNKISVRVFSSSVWAHHHTSFQQAAVTHTRTCVSVFWQVNQTGASAWHTERLLEKTNMCACHTLTVYGFMCVVCIRWFLFQCLAPRTSGFSFVLTQMCCFEPRDVCFWRLFLMRAESAFLLSHFEPGCRVIIVTDKAGTDREQSLICVDTHLYRSNVCFCTYANAETCHVCAVPLGATCALLLCVAHIFLWPFNATRNNYKRPGTCSHQCFFFFNYSVCPYITYISHYRQTTGNSLSKINHLTFDPVETSVGLAISVFLSCLNHCPCLSQAVPCPEISSESAPQNAVLCGQEEVSGKQEEIQRRATTQSWETEMKRETEKCVVLCCVCVCVCAVVQEKEGGGTQRHISAAALLWMCMCVRACLCVNAWNLHLHVFFVLTSAQA